MRLIDADDVIMRHCEVECGCTREECGLTYEEDGCDGCTFVKEIENAPSVYAEPVRHGRWDDSGRYKFKDGRVAVRCTECGCALSEDEFKKYAWVYCPICGAKMDGGETHADD